MSDKKESNDKSLRKSPEGKPTGKKEKSGTVSREKKLIDQHSKFDNRSSDEQQSKGSSQNEVGEHMNKQHELKKELKELFENFERGQPDPEAKKNPLHSPQTFAATKENNSSESYTKCSLENMVSTDFSRENNKDSTDTTLDGKFIEIREEICDCHAEKCICGQTEQNCTDIEDSQAHLESSEVTLPHDCYTRPLPTIENDLEEGNYEDPQINQTNRYNYNQVQIRRNQKEKSVLNKLFPRREMTSRHHSIKNDSGETIPQLYKANIKNLWNCGAVPERFTFKAVTGNLPGKLEYAPCCHHSFMAPGTYPCFPTGKHRVNFMEDNFDKIDNNAHKRQKKENKFPFKHLKRYRRFKHPERNNLKIQKSENGFYNNKHETLDKACLRFDGNEYVSTKQLPDRIDIYCFDHLNTSYFRTCDQPPPLITDIAMEKTEEVATRFWAEIFGFIHVIIAFFIAFILQFYKFLLYSMLRPIMVGLVQLTSDYFFKPLLTITYNGFTQPLLVFLFNVAASFRDLCSPIAKGLGYFISEIAVLLRAIRLVDYGKNTSIRQMKDSSC